MRIALRQCLATSATRGFETPSSLLTLAAALFVLSVVGCGGDDTPPPPTTNKNVISAQGDYVGHLKPHAHLPTSEEDTVVWVVRGSEVTKRDDSLSVHGFRLDFDELLPLSEADLPFALMTENTKEIVIHRGQPAGDVFTNPEINNGERCLTVFHCSNIDCPRFQEMDNLALFPHDPASGQATCPYCNKTEFTGKYELPQYGAMRRFLDRKKARAAEK